ncbi:MAG: hypothetical protein HND48_09820 [Chloroflexi bacterium]|nr:hypothetical protein [Chloroflexota bacterium]
MLTASSMEAAAEADDAYMEKYFSDGVISNDEIRDGMRKAARNHELNTVPVFVTSGTKNIGTYPVLEALIAYTSSPSVRRVGIHRGESTEIEYMMPPQSDDNPLAAYVFKTVNDRFVGTQSFVRLFSGVLRSDSRNWNNTKGEEERFGQLSTMRGKELIPLAILHAGDIGVVPKLQHTQTGDTIGDRDKNFTLVSPGFSEPLYSVALQPKTQQDATKIGSVLGILTQADPTLRWRNDPNTSQIVLEGMGEIHVQVALARREARVKRNHRNPQSAVQRDDHPQGGCHLPAQETVRWRGPIRGDHTVHRAEPRRRLCLRYESYWRRGHRPVSGLHEQGHPTSAANRRNRRLPCRGRSRRRL